jgi:hypothetical protein
MAPIVSSVLGSTVVASIKQSDSPIRGSPQLSQSPIAWQQGSEGSSFQTPPMAKPPRNSKLRITDYQLTLLASIYPFPVVSMTSG